MTEQEIQNAFAKEYWINYEILIPNFHPPKWWECDLWGLKKSGYSIEYEIKTSKADFKRDFKKGYNYYRNKKKITVTKHNCLEGGYKYKLPPNRFCFIIPEDLDVEIPKYAGIVRYGKYFTIEKPPPLLHSKKTAVKTIVKAGKSLSCRLWAGNNRWEE